MDDQTPACPMCNSRRHVITSGENVHTFACRACCIQFEDVDDGDISYGRPGKRMERQERACERAAVQRNRRSNYRGTPRR